MLRALLLLVLGATTHVVATVNWNVHYSCDKVIGESKIGGFLTFDSDFLPSHHQYECIVQVRTATFDTLRVSGILFHFADVEIGRNGCDNANLTVVDGKLRQWTIHQDYITGLNTPICGRNSSLTKDLVFTSRHDQVTLIFKRNRYGVKYKSTFNITFVAFYKGNCDEFEELSPCNKSPDDEYIRCISKELACLGINLCGDYPDCSGSIRAEAEALTIWETILLLIVTVIGGGIIFTLLKQFQKRNLSELPLIGCLCDRPSCKGSTDRQNRRASVSEPPEISELTTQIIGESHALSRFDYDDHSPTGSSPERPSPPSYDEVMTNSNRYKK